MTSKRIETNVCYVSCEELMQLKFRPEEKMNQRLFKRLILYYNVGNATKVHHTAKYSQKQTALHQTL
jgi:hypothetical protein